MTDILLFFLMFTPAPLSGTNEIQDLPWAPALLVAANQSLDIWDLYNNINGYWETQTSLESSTTDVCLQLDGYCRSRILDLWRSSDTMEVVEVRMSLLNELGQPTCTMVFKEAWRKNPDTWFTGKTLQQSSFLSQLKKYSFIFDHTGIRIQSSSQGFLDIRWGNNVTQFFFVTTGKPSEMPMVKSEHVREASYFMIELAFDYMTSSSAKPATTQETTAVNETTQPGVSEANTGMPTATSVPDFTSETNHGSLETTSTFSRHSIVTSCVTRYENGSQTTSVFRHRILSSDEKRKVVADIYDSLVIPRKSASLYKRRLASAIDHRVSCSVLGGSVAILTITLIFGLVLLMDLTSLRHHCSFLDRNHRCKHKVSST